MEIYVPDMYKKSIYVIDYKKLKESGIKCLLFDLDNTLVPYSVKKPTKKVKDLFKSLQEQGFKVIIFSNSGKKRLQPFKEELAVDVCPRAFKPSTKKFISIMKELKSPVSITLDRDVIDIIKENVRDGYGLELQCEVIYIK